MAFARLDRADEDGVASRHQARRQLVGTDAFFDHQVSAGAKNADSRDRNFVFLAMVANVGGDLLGRHQNEIGERRNVVKHFAK